MRLEIQNKDSFLLHPENYQDKLWLMTFYKNIDKKALSFIDLTFTYSDERSVNEKNEKIQGGGWIDPHRLYDHLFDAEENDGVAVEEIDDMQITNYQI